MRAELLGSEEKREMGAENSCNKLPPVLETPPTTDNIQKLFESGALTPSPVGIQTVSWNAFSSAH